MKRFTTTTPIDYPHRYQVFEAPQRLALDTDDKTAAVRTLQRLARTQLQTGAAEAYLWDSFYTRRYYYNHAAWHTI